MDELSPLFQDIEFRERLRGYDVEEVDAYIDRIAKAAALVQGRIAELQQRTEAAEARLADRGPGVEADDSMSRVLLMAQRTADAAVAEAEAEAAELLASAHADAAATRADADEYASRVLAEAETDRRQAVADAESAAAEAIAHERDRVAGAIAELEQYKAFLTEDIDILERHLDASRAALNASLVNLSDLLETPEVFRAPTMPATSGALAPDVLTEIAAVEPAADLDAEPIDLTAPDVAPDAEPDDSTLGAEHDAVEAAAVEEMAVEALGAEDDAVEEIAAEEVVAEPETVVGDEWAEPMEAVAEVVSTDTAVTAFDEHPEPVADPGMHEPVAMHDAEPEALDEPIAAIDLTVAPPLDFEPPAAEAAIPAPAPPLLVTAADLEVAPADDAGDEWVRDVHFDAGPITEPVPAVADQLLFTDAQAAPTTAADPFLEQLRDAVARDDADDFGDDALAAFFDGEVDDGGRSWFPRRR